MPRVSDEHTVKDFLDVMKDKVITGPEGSYILASDLRDIETKFGFTAEEGKKHYRSFEEAQRAFVKDHKELIQLNTSRPRAPAHERRHHTTGRLSSR